VHSPAIASQYDDFLANTALVQFDLRWIAELLPPARHADAILADLGCGTGRTLRLAHDRGYRVLGIDLSDPMLREFQKRSQQNTSDSTTRQSSTSSPTIPPTARSDWALRANMVALDGIAAGVVDHAVCLFSTLGMIRSRRNRRLALGHIRRILRSGGSLFLHVHNRWAALRDHGGVTHLSTSWLRSLRDAEFDFGDRVYGYRGLPNMFLHSYGRFELAADLRAAGFSVRRITPLAVSGDGPLPWGWLAGGIRAGGFMVWAE
jgi:SAM-dependent methyltransferase